MCAALLGPGWAPGAVRSATPVELYVAPNGSDGASGTLGKPFATLERARDEIRRIKNRGGLPKGGATVFVRAGAYELAHTFELGAEDPGSKAAPVVYQAYAGEKPVLTGSKQISGFVPHQGAILKADVAAQGFKGVGFRQLFFNGKRQHLARYPNFDPANPNAGRDNVIENNILIDHSQRQATYSGHSPKSSVVAGHLKAFQKRQHNPAYAKYPEVARIDLSTAWRMVGNQFIRNIVYYRESEARLYSLWRNDFAEQNVFDYNVVFHFGLPLLTGCRKAGETRGPNLLANAGFEEAAADGMPSHWRLRDPLPAGVRIAATRDQALLIEATANEAKPRSIAVLSDRVPAVSGETYVLRARMKAQEPGTLAQIAVQTDRASGKNWQGHVPRASLHVSREWRQYELCFKLPAPGERWHEPEMKTMPARVLRAGDAGPLWVDDAWLSAAAMMDQWEAWRTEGFDQHSIVADPLFVNPGRGDYRLRPESPALKLGFKPIPVERIGPYKDDLRATWPIVEAEGVRELGFPEAPALSRPDPRR